jgi:putative salt-induced outer membrane protein YdiY
VDKFNNYVINAEIGIEADLTKKKDLTLRAFLQDTYNNEPAAGREKNDARLVTAIAYKF